MSRTVLLGQSLGTAVTAATALYYTDPTSPLLPSSLATLQPPKPAKESFAGIILVAPFRTLPLLLQHYRIAGIFPILKPLQPYPVIANFLSSRIIDTWPTLPRLQSFISAEKSKKHGFFISLLHARNDQDISYHESETLFEPLQTLMLGSAEYSPEYNDLVTDLFEGAGLQLRGLANQSKSLTWVLPASVWLFTKARSVPFRSRAPCW